MGPARIPAVDERRKAILRKVNNWPAGEETISANRLAGLLVGGEEDPLKHVEQLKLFKALVDEGFIDATVGKPPDGPLPFGWAKVRGLTPLGLQMIQ